MGSSSSSSSKETKEMKVNNDPNLTTGQHKELSEKSESSLCEIKTNDGYGTGFICTLKFPDKNTKIVCLITNYHVINEDMINFKENIEIILNKENIKIDLMKERRIWMDEKIDYTIIELLKEDNIFQSIKKSFDIYDNCYNYNYNKNNYDKKYIVIAAISITKEIKIGQGILYTNAEELEKNKYIFFHDCNTDEGYSGGPIILKQDLSIMGIHRGAHKEKKMNLGKDLLSKLKGIFCFPNEIN